MFSRGSFFWLFFSFRKLLRVWRRISWCLAMACADWLLILLRGHSSTLIGSRSGSFPIHFLKILTAEFLIGPSRGASSIFWESNFWGERLIKRARRFLNSRDLRLNTKVKWVHRLSNGGEQKTGMGKNILQTTDKFNLNYGFIYFLHIQCPLISWHKIVVLVFNQILIN